MGTTKGGGVLVTGTNRNMMGGGEELIFYKELINNLSIPKAYTGKRRVHTINKIW